MNKTLLNIRYKMGYQFTWAAWYLVCYLITMLLMYYIFIKTSVIISYTGGFIYRLWGVVIFQFAVSMRFKEDFDFLLTLSNTRKNIFQTLLGAAVGFSAFFSCMIVLERLTVDFFNDFFGYHNIIDSIHSISPYAVDNLFLQLIFFFMLCVCCSTFGLVMGSLFYRFGKKFTLAFWLIFSSVPVAFFPLLIWPGRSTKFFTAAGDFLRNFDVPACSGYLFILTSAFCFAAYLNIRRLPQK